MICSRCHLESGIKALCSYGGSAASAFSLVRNAVSRLSVAHTLAAQGTLLRCSSRNLKACGRPQGQVWLNALRKKERVQLAVLKIDFFLETPNLTPWFSINWAIFVWVEIVSYYPGPGVDTRSIPHNQIVTLTLPAWRWILSRETWALHTFVLRKKLFSIEMGFILFVLAWPRVLVDNKH